jgi:hypothetical protein
MRSGSRVGRSGAQAPLYSGLLLAILAAFAAGALMPLLMTFLVGSDASAGARTETGCRTLPDGHGASAAAAVQLEFVRTAVVRRRTACSFELVTDNLRQGLSRSEWATGNIPVQPFPTRFPETVRPVLTRLGPAAPDERVSRVVLEAADLGSAAFELVLVEREGRWLVDYWAPAVLLPVPRTG